MTDEKAESGAMTEEQKKVAREAIPQFDSGRTTLKIWDVPLGLAQKFINTSKSSYSNKSWLLLQDLMAKADRYDEWVSSGKIAELDQRITAIEYFINTIQATEAVVEADANKLPEETKAKVPKTFGV